MTLRAEIRGSGSAFTVTIGGRRYGGTATSWDAACALANSAEAAAHLVARLCMVCGGAFASAGPRRCDPCRKAEAVET